VHIRFGGARLSGDWLVGSSPGDAVIYGTDPGDLFGLILNHGDVDGDGIEDLLVAAPNADGAGVPRHSG
jgi:hypothetical protein